MSAPQSDHVGKHALDLAGKRYGEVLLVTAGEAGPQATVYNSFPLNDCPADLWSALDPHAIAAENGVAASLTRIRAGEGAHVKLVQIQLLGSKARRWNAVAVEEGPGAKVEQVRVEQVSVHRCVLVTDRVIDTHPPGPESLRRKGVRKPRVPADASTVSVIEPGTAR